MTGMLMILAHGKYVDNIEESDTNIIHVAEKKNNRIKYDYKIL